MFDKIINNIIKSIVERNDCYSIFDFINEVYEELPSYIVNVPDKSDYEFWEFCGKLMQKIQDKHYPEFYLASNNESGLLIWCPDELNSLYYSLQSRSGEDITEDLIKVLSTYDTNIDAITSTDDIEQVWCELFGDKENWYDLDNLIIDEVQVYDAFEISYEDLNDIDVTEELDLHPSTYDQLVKHYISWYKEIGYVSYDELLSLYNNEIYQDVLTPSFLTFAKELYAANIKITDIPDYAETFVELFDADREIIDENYEDYSEIDIDVLNDLVDSLQYQDEMITTIDEIESALPDRLTVNQAKSYLTDMGWTIKKGLTYYTDEDKKYLDHDGVNTNFYNGPGLYDMETLELLIPDNLEHIDTDEFIATGYKSISNLGDWEIQISDDGDCARIKYGDGTISDWCEIRFDEESRAYINPYDFAADEDDYEYLDTYMKY